MPKRKQGRNEADPLTRTRYERIRGLLAAGAPSPLISQETGFSESTVQKVRCGAPLTILEDVWCPRCRQRVFAPCQRCRLRIWQASDEDPLERWQSELHQGLSWSELCQRELCDTPLAVA